jgi:hypothetical protein
MKLVVEAMDIMHRRNLDGFCIASSDGDFTPLIARIRANALSVYGFGAKTAPEAYKAEFDKFCEYDTLLAAEKKTTMDTVVRPGTTLTASLAPTKARPAQVKTTRPTQPAKPPIVLIPAELRKTILDAIEETTGSNGRAHAGPLGNAIRRRLPNFRSKDYGYGTLVKLLLDLEGVRVTKEGTVTYITLKPAQ